MPHHASHPGVARPIIPRPRPNTCWKSPVVGPRLWVFGRVTTSISEGRFTRRLREQCQKRHNPASQCQVQAVHHATWRCTMLDVVIRGGLVVTPEDVGERDIGVQEGKIVAIASPGRLPTRSEEHTSELQSLAYLVCRLLLEKKKKKDIDITDTH